MQIIINNQSGTRIDDKMISKVVKKISNKKLIVGISFVRKDKMKKLNKVFRHKNKPTDVLSFNMNEGRLLGDIIICPSVAKANALKFGSTFMEEIARLTAHGMLHLLGFDHGKKMFDLQEKILAGI